MSQQPPHSGALRILPSQFGMLDLYYSMKARTQPDFELLPVVPIDDDTHAMLAYAASPEVRTHIEQARRELQEGKGIIVTPGYFDEMKRRVAQRRKGARKWNKNPIIPIPTNPVPLP
jgi:hypothetical protein